MTREWFQRFGLDRAHADALVEFARGYLHEDVVTEHGGGVQAAAAFAAGASLNERAQVALALDVVALGAAEYSPARLARLFSRDLRCAWTPSSPDELSAMAAEIRNR